MNIFILLIFFVLGLLWIPINADDFPTLGISPCVYSGSYDESGAYGYVLPMPVSSLPMECTSFIYDGLIYDNSSGFNPPIDSIKNMKALNATGKRLFLIYTHGSLTQWMSSLDSSIDIEIEALSSFLKDNAASGIILKDLDYNYDANLTFHVDTDFYSNLNKSILGMKQSIIGLKIGIYVNASNIIYHNINSSSQDFFDFTVLNDAVDFYIIEFDGFNECNDVFRGGIVPLCGPKSLVTFAEAYESSTIAKNKVYLEFSANPTPDITENNLPICGITYQKLCEDSKCQKMWCADNSDSLYYKGEFAKQTINAQGIVIKYIDTIDPAGSCNCDLKNKFITFNMLLRGFKLADNIKDCTSINDFTAVKCSKTGN